MCFWRASYLHLFHDIVVNLVKYTIVRIWLCIFYVQLADNRDICRGIPVKLKTVNFKEANMRSFLLKQVGEWSKKYANLPDRYIERAMQQVCIILKLQPNKNDTCIKCHYAC
jgi:hypothetical protein